MPDKVLRKPGDIRKGGFHNPDPETIAQVEQKALSNIGTERVKKVTTSIHIDEDVYQELRSMKFHGEIKDFSRYIIALIKDDFIQRGKEVGK